MIILFADECHLLWGDLCGYLWAKRGIRTEIPIENERQKQTYYGALNYKTKEFFLRAYPQGNSYNTITFLEWLRRQHKEKQIVIIWDGASYHRSQDIQAYLARINGDKIPSIWPLRCIRLAPYAPEQNPVETVWLQGKRGLREYWGIGHSFGVVKWLFEHLLHQQTFDFKKLGQLYGQFS